MQLAVINGDDDDEHLYENPIQHRHNKRKTQKREQKITSSSLTSAIVSVKSISSKNKKIPGNLNNKCYLVTPVPSIFIWLIILIFFGHMSSTTFFRLIEANYLSPQSILKSVIKEQQSHHHRHHPHQMLEKSAVILDQNSYDLAYTTATTTTAPMTMTSTSKTNNNTIPIMKQKQKKKMAQTIQNKFTENTKNSMKEFTRATSRMNNTFDVDSFLPPGYDKLMPPKQSGNPTVVRFHVWVLGLDSIDEGSMTYVADIFMSQSWKDNRLVIPDDIIFNVNTSTDPRGPYRLLPLTFIDKIWRPDSFFKNAKEVTFQEMTIPNHYIWLYSDNTILYMVKLTLLLSCAMKFQTYPHDTQNCTMKIESLSYTTNDLVFDWEESDPLVVEEHIELPQHDLIQKDIDYCTTDYSSGTFACVQVVFTIKRRLGYYIFHTYIPTCLIVIMSWISFWIKPEAVPARVTLCVTSLLTLSTQHAQSQKSLPPVSYIKAIDIFMSSCTLFVFASLMEYALVNILMSDELLNGWIGITPTVYQEPKTTTVFDQSIRQRRSSTTTFNTVDNLQDHKVTNHRIDRTQQPHYPVRFHSLTRLDKLGINSNNSNISSDHLNDEYQSRTNENVKNAGYHQCAEDVPMSSGVKKVSILRHRYCSMLNRDDATTAAASKDQPRESGQKFTPYFNATRNQSFSFYKSPNRTCIQNLDQSINQFLLQSKHRRAYAVDHISRWIFPLSFAILNVVYWAYYLDVWNSLGVTHIV